MIRFIQDYTTKALPPEHFERDQEVSRSPESELYFVQLGVAGFLVDGVLVGQDYQPLVTNTVVQVVSPGDRRFADVGRGGEVIGLDAPQRASTGPGNTAVFGAAANQTELTQVEFDQLRADLAASVEQFDEHRATSGAEIERLTGRETELVEQLRVSNVEQDRLKGTIDKLEQDLKSASAIIGDLEKKVASGAEATGQLDAAKADLASAQRRVAELEAAASKSKRG